MHKSLVLILLLGLLASFLSCSSSRQQVEEEEVKTKASKYYTSSFPSGDVSELLTNIQRSILKIISTSYYNTYIFDPEQVTFSDIQASDLSNIAVQQLSDEQSSSGTSILLAVNKEKALFITCNHVVSSPDTLTTYYNSSKLSSNRFLETISIKKRQNKLLFTSNKLYDFKIIASDSHNDLALISASLGVNDPFDRLPLDMEMGDTNFLRTGSFLYILGFPKGYFMVTRAIASTTEDANHRFFISDALFNPGISGGLVIASKNNFNSFQWIGMARSSIADSDDFLVPRRAPTKYEQNVRPYRDSIFVQKKIQISYGVTQAIPINRIKVFINQNKKAIKQQGFSFSFE